MKKALYFKKLKSNLVQCQLCPYSCIIKPGDHGNCQVRVNKDGELFSVVYGKPIAASVDPIEKKPLFHFLPGERVFSIGTAGCNLHCLHCQNWTSSQTHPNNHSPHDLSPEKVVEQAINQKCRIIAYTYNEPTIFFEYVLDTAKIAKKKGLKNVIVSNGYINPAPLKELCKYIDAANLDLKSFDEDFYNNVSKAHLKNVLDSLKILKQENVWLEITNLIIPTLNDNPLKIKEMCDWIVQNLGADIPLHFSAFHPTYKLQNLPPTSPKTLFEAKRMAEASGLNFVYIGNIFSEQGENTLCPKCRKKLISRPGYSIRFNHLKNGKCSCSQKIPGVWD